MTQPPNEITTPIAETVSEALGIPIETLPPLSEAIELDGLEALITDDAAHDVTVTFACADLRVVVHSDRTVYARTIRNTRTGATDGTPDDNR